MLAAGDRFRSKAEGRPQATVIAEEIGERKAQAAILNGIGRARLALGRPPKRG